MGKLLLLSMCINMLFVSQAFSLSLAGEWQLESGIAAVLDPEGDEAVGRDNSPISSPGNAYYWSFADLLSTGNILGAFIDNGDGTAWQKPETSRVGVTYMLHGDSLWGQPPGTIYEVFVKSYFAGTSFYQMIHDEWVWKSTAGSSQVKEKSKDNPLRFELTDHVYFDYYGYNDVVGYNTFFGPVTDVVGSIFPIPEPSTIFLFGTGLAGLVALRRRRT